MRTYKISEQYTNTPGLQNDICDFSGTNFLEKVLLRELDAAIKSNQKLLIDLDDTTGYPMSFIKQSFGKAAGMYDVDILDVLLFKSDDDPFLVDDIRDVINSVNDLFDDGLS